MGLRHAGYALDFLLIGLTGYLFAQAPLLKDVAANGWQVVYSLADGPAYHKADGVVFASAVHQKWFDYMFGDNLGRYAATNPDCAQFHALDAWLNSLVLPAAVRAALPHMIAVWARNLLAGLVLYYVTGFAWAFVLYVARRDHFFPGDKVKEIPSWADMKVQIAVSTNAMVVYTLMPTWAEWFMERGLSKAYLAWPELTPQGIGAFVGWLAAYIFLVEWGIFWCHYSLHFKIMYPLHKPHHIYNKELSPFASLAFHPIDGCIQACPYLIFIFAVPVHFWANLGLLFFTGVWATNIHDTIMLDSEPIMGAGYHTLHHSLYKDNYGQFFILFDYLHETLTPPAHRMKQWGWDARKKKSVGVKSE